MRILLSFVLIFLLSNCRDMSPEELLNRDYYSGRFASMIDGKPVYNWETDWKLEELV